MPRCPEALNTAALFAELTPTYPVEPPACKFCGPLPVIICDVGPLVPPWLDPLCCELLPPMPVVMPCPVFCGLAPPVPPSDVDPNMPLVVLPRLACAYKFPVNTNSAAIATPDIAAELSKRFISAAPILNTILVFVAGAVNDGPFYDANSSWSIFCAWANCL